MPEEKVVPELQSNISDNKTIRITAGDNEEVKASETAVLSSSVTAEDLLQENYNRVVEKLVVEETNIPFETETKNLGKKSKEVILLIILILIVLLIINYLIKIICLVYINYE